MKINKRDIFKAIFISYITIVLFLALFAWLIIFTSNLSPSINNQTVLQYLLNILVKNINFIFFLIPTMFISIVLIFIYKINNS